jgi:hypothetical protein
MTVEGGRQPVKVEQCMNADQVKEYEDMLHRKLPALLAKQGAAGAYRKAFTPIFEFIQLAPLSPGQKRGDNDKEVDRRMGKRKPILRCNCRE